MIPFENRHIGPRETEIQEMLNLLGEKTLEGLSQKIVPTQIRLNKDLSLPAPATETEGLQELDKIASQNKVFRSLIGMGYSDAITPPVILRNIFENPGWYTQYTPYQAEIAQGRLEALLNFQTMIIEMTGLPVANASLLDEATAAAEGMALCFAAKDRPSGKSFFVSDEVFPHTVDVIKTRAEALNISIKVGSVSSIDFDQGYFGVLVQNPNKSGLVEDYTNLFNRAHQAGALCVVAADLMSLALFKSPGSMGADIAIGSAQRFGVPVGFGGPHAAFMSTKEELKRLLPGRIVGVSEDAQGKKAIRLALQTREQHIRRDKATSNICTSQVLLAVMASMYAVYHGPKGLYKIAKTIFDQTLNLAEGLKAAGATVLEGTRFDTVTVKVEGPNRKGILDAFSSQGFNLCGFYENKIQITLDERTTPKEVEDLIQIWAMANGKPNSSRAQKEWNVLEEFKRKDPFLTHAIFEKHHSETEMLRYIFKLQAKDLSLTHSMIALGSCTMKLNATAEMIPVTWPAFGALHPFAPKEQRQGYSKLFFDLESWLSEITGFDAISLQPNAGSQGEYAGLLVIKKFHESRGQGHRNVCLIPKSAHGTNPASAAMAGMQVVVVDCDRDGNVDLSDLQKKASEHAKNLSALMVSYPSTHGVFEEQIKQICETIHGSGGQVYMDGANMNAQIGLCRPGDFGADVCHLNLHKTFCIPHGGGGPGMGPIGVKAHLKEFLPNHSVVKDVGGRDSVGAIAAGPWGSASILPISWMYIRMMGAAGLKRATEVAILNANYVAKRLENAFPVLYKGKNGFVAHECIFDFRKFKDSAGVEVEDVAKRLMDYGFHAPTISFPVAGTIMVEPTESESKAELDRFCDAMISIREEIAEIEAGKAERTNNLLKNAPHTAEQIASDEWSRPYSRQRAAFPLKWVRDGKFWPAVGRINNVMGDRNLICACPPMEEWGDKL